MIRDRKPSQMKKWRIRAKEIKGIKERKKGENKKVFEMNPKIMRKKATLK